MDNNEFRKLLSERSSEQNGANSADAISSQMAKKHLTGMAPRAIRGAGTDFAQQKRERDASSQSTKKFKSFVPRGVKYGSGYVDRARAREATTSNENEKEAEIQALEKQVKEGKITQSTFERLRDKITGGDIANTHLVKGLDRQLLARVRKGELGGDVADQSGDGETADVDDELDQIASKDFEQVTREKAAKKGTLAVAGRKRTRDEILAELKAQRAAAREASLGVAPVLDSSKFKKIDTPGTHRIHIDEKGREVLTIVGEDGTVKKKIRKVSGSQLAPGPPELPPQLPDSGSAESIKNGVAEDNGNDGGDDDDDIFADAGTEYNPLGDLPSGDDDDEEVDGGDRHARDNGRSKATNVEQEASHPAHDPRPQEDSQAGTLDADHKPRARNYFNDSSVPSEETSEADRFAGIHLVLKKAATLNQVRNGADSGDKDDKRVAEEDAKSKRRAEMLSARDRDLDDMDLCFGGSRNDDEDEAADEGSKLRLSEWKGLKTNVDDDADWDDQAATSSKKKRKPKKRKGDVNNVADIMRVIEGRKSKGK